MNEIIPAGESSLLPAKEAERVSLVQEFENVGINEKYVATQLKHIIENAECSTPKGDIVEDYATKLMALKTWHKMKTGTPDVQVNVANIFQGSNSGL